MRLKLPELALVFTKYIRNKFFIDVSNTHVEQTLAKEDTTTKRVMYYSDLTRSIDSTLDTFSVYPTDPVSQNLLITGGTFQWFGHIIDATDTFVLDGYVPFTYSDCPSGSTISVRLDLIVMYASYDAEQGKHVVKYRWIFGDPGTGKYPAFPDYAIPIAIVTTEPYTTCIEMRHIQKYATMFRGHPSVKFWRTPVPTVKDLYYLDEVEEGTVCFVKDDCILYSYQKGRWVAVGNPASMNTFHVIDATTYLNRFAVPWAVRNDAELTIFRDGQLMVAGQDYDYVLHLGIEPYILFNYDIEPEQRIVMVHNPVLGAMQDKALDPLIYDINYIYVDGARGLDVYSGTEDEPFKTLQKAFDTIPLVSKDDYIIYAKNLKLADTVTYENRKVYGFCYNKTLNNLTVNIDIDSSEWDNTIMSTYWFILDSLSVSKMFNAMAVLKSSCIIKNCTGAIGNLEFDCIVQIMIGSHYLHHITTTDNCSFIISNRASVYVTDSIFDKSKILVNTHAFLQIVFTSVGYVRGSYGNFVLEQVNVSDSLFSFSHVYATNSNFLLPTYFEMSTFYAVQSKTKRGVYLDQTLFKATDCEIEGFDSICVNVFHNSSIIFNNVAIKNSFTNIYSPIHVTGASSAVCKDIVIYEQHRKHGVTLESSSYGTFTDCRLIDSPLYAVFANEFSSAVFPSDIWAFRGAEGQYLQAIPGADMTKVDGADLSAGYLNDKLVAGKGLKKEVVDNLGTKTLKFSADPTDTTPSFSRGAVFALTSYNLSPQETVTVPMVDGEGVPFYADSYITSVLAPSTTYLSQTHYIFPTLIHRSKFIEQESNFGTTFHNDKVTLYYSPSLGYTITSGYYFYIRPNSSFELTTYGVSQINSLTIEYDQPTGTEIRVAISVDNGNTWIGWDGGGWSTLTGSTYLERLSKGMAVGVIPNIPVSGWTQLLTQGQSIIVGFYLATSVTTSTPAILNISWDILRVTAFTDISKDFIVSYVGNDCLFTYTGTTTVAGPFKFTVLPVFPGN